MPLPTTEADLQALKYADITRGNLSAVTMSFTEPLKLPKLRPLWRRAWCGLRGHGGLTPMPGDVFYQNDKLCKRCGARVSLL
jgi:hypothetical protein